MEVELSTDVGDITAPQPCSTRAETETEKTQTKTPPPCSNSNSKIDIESESMNESIVQYPESEAKNDHQDARQIEYSTTECQQLVQTESSNSQMDVGKDDPDISMEQDQFSDIQVHQADQPHIESQHSDQSSSKSQEVDKQPSSLEEQTPQQLFIGPQIPYEISSTSHQTPQQPFTGPQTLDSVTSDYEQNIQPAFIGPQIPDSYSSYRQNYQQTDPELFIGPQIPDNYMKETVPPVPSDSKYSFSPTSSMTCVNKVSSTFTKYIPENYLRGCKWSPDGSQVLTNSNDNILRTFIPGPPPASGNDSVEELNPSCFIKESALVYDYCWLPTMLESQPDTCRVACSCPGSPIHLWDTQNSCLVSSYRAFDHCDEVTSAYSLSFSPDGSKLYGGYKNSIRVFDTEYSHRKCSVIKTLNPKTKEGHKGIISCFSHGAPGSNTFVTGSYSKHVGIYYSLTNELVCLIQGQQGGVTHIMISPDGNRLYTGGRKDPEIVCWDMRNTGQVLCTFLRDVQTNQRIYFDLSQSGRYLVSGNHDGSVQIWDTLEAGHEVAGEIIMKPCCAFQAHNDCTNGVSFNHQRSLLATASGQRHFKNFDSDSSDSDDDGNSGGVKMEKKHEEPSEFSLKIWSIPCTS